MSKVIIESYDEFAKLLGQQIGVSDWLEVDQDRINQFADATLDHQWIHVDVERARLKVHSRALLFMAILHCRCFHISGIRL